MNMQNWKPKNFKAEYPSPEEGCAFVLGGSLHGAIIQGHPLPRYFRHAAPQQRGATIETYRREEFRVGSDQRTVWFYIHESESTDVLLIRALTELCMFKRGLQTSE